jgi:branched-chain amino acid transport system permease protein
MKKDHSDPIQTTEGFAVSGLGSPVGGGLLPKDVRIRPPLRRAIWVAAIGALLVALAATGLGLDQLGTLSTITSIFVLIVLAQSWNILGGYGGYLNLGMVAFFGIGAYTTGVLAFHFGWSPLWTMFLGGVVSAAFAALIGLPSLRVRGSYFAILTLIITFLVQLLIINMRFTRGALGLYVEQPDMAPRTRIQFFYFLFFAMAVVATVVVYSVEHSKFGNALVTIREDEDAAQILGIRTTRVKMQAFVIGAYLAGVAGGLFTLRSGYIEPSGTFMLDTSIDVVLMTIVGGLGTWQGALIGVPLIEGAAEVLRVGVTRLGIFGVGVPTEFSRVVFGLVLIFVALFAPRGVMGFFRRVGGRRRRL